MCNQNLILDNKYLIWNLLEQQVHLKHTCSPQTKIIDMFESRKVY